MSYDALALIREYAAAKTDYDFHRLSEDFTGKEKERYNRLVAIEQLLIHVAGAKP